MTVKQKPSAWVDPDDAPEWSEEDFRNATWRIGQRQVSSEQGIAAFQAQAKIKADNCAEQAVTIRYSSDVIDAFRASGPGWQSRMNEALRDWLRNHKPA